MIELLDLGETDVHHRTPGAVQLGNHVRQTMKRLRSEHEIDERRAMRDCLAFLARHTTAHTDKDVRTLGL